MKKIEDFEMAASSDLDAFSSFPEDARIVDDGMCSVYRVINFQFMLKVEF